MKLKEFEVNPQTSKLVQVLRTVIGDADARGTSVYLHFDKPTEEEVRQGSMNIDINKLMQNVGGEQFDYGTFKAAYDTDPRVKTMVQDFNEKGITPKTSKKPDGMDQTDPDPESNTVSQMAKSATDLGDKL